MVIKKPVMSGRVFTSAWPLRIAALKENLLFISPSSAESCLLQSIDRSGDSSELGPLAGQAPAGAVVPVGFRSPRCCVSSLFKLWGADVMASSRQKSEHKLALK